MTSAKQTMSQTVQVMIVSGFIISDGTQAEVVAKLAMTVDEVEIDVVRCNFWVISNAVTCRSRDSNDTVTYN